MQSGMQLAQYRIIRRIGAGGMAEVFLAEKTGAAGFSRQVAIKTIIAAGAAQESIGLFLDEARVAAALQHANIVQTLDLGFENDTLFIAMEYVPGPPLSRVIKELKDRDRRLPPTLVAYIGAKVANALDYAHRRVTTAQGQALALVHRDISPQNILLSRNGMVKLMDFGVARASIQMHKTKTGQVRGKAAYMAPEQVRAQKLDGRTDMFALGLVLYEMLTAYRPFQRQNEISSMRAIISEDVPPLHDRNPDVPDDLEEAVMRCLRRPPDERFAHCGELEEVLLRTIRSERLSGLEEQLVVLLEELFGQEQFSDNMPDVEAWQPTMASVDTPVTPRFKVPGNGLSPEIAALLQTPQTPMAAPMPEPSLDAGLGPRGYAQQQQRPPAAFTQPPQQLPPGISYDPTTGVLYDAQGAPIDPSAVMLATPNGGLTPGSLPSATNLRMVVNSNGQMQGMLSGTANGLSPYSLQSVPVMTPASSPSIQTSVASGNVKLVVAVLASFLAGICLMVLLREDKPEVVQSPIPSAPPSAPRALPSTPPSVAGTAVSPAAASPAAASPAAPSPTASSASAPPTAPSEDGRTARRDPVRPRVATPSPTPAEPSAAPASAPPKLDKADLLKRAMAVKTRAMAAGQADVAQKMGALAGAWLEGREPTPAEADELRKAEKALP